MAEEVRAELVANIAKVVVAVGDHVGAGEMVILLESMKMEIPMLVEFAGTRTVYGFRGEIMGALDTHE